MKRTVLHTCLALSLLAAPGLTPATDVYTRLVPSGPVLPPLVPQRAVNNTCVGGAFAEVFLAAQPYLVRLGVDKELQRVAAQALAEAEQVGQAGVLLKTRIAVQQLGMQEIHYPLGSGVSLVGRGSTPEAVLFSQGLNVLEPPVPEGMRLDTSASLYIWITRGSASGQALKEAYYDIAALESYTRSVQANQLSRQAMQEATKAAFIEGYGRMLEATAKTEEDRKFVQALMQSRSQASERLKSVEQTLSTRLEQAEKAARAAALWNTLSAVFSVSSSVALASATTGQKIQTPNGQTPKTAAELTQALDALTAQTKAAAEAFKQKVEVERALLKTLEESLLKSGTLRGQPVQQQDWRLLLH